MAVDKARPLPSLRVIEGGRGTSPLIEVRRDDVLAAVLDAIAIAVDAGKTAVRIHNAELERDVPSLAVLSHAAGLAHRAKASCDEMRRIARHIDGGDTAA
jgi:hypothetical protein